MLVPEPKIQRSQVERYLEYMVDIFAIILLRSDVHLFQLREALRRGASFRQIKDIVTITCVRDLPNLAAIFPKLRRTPHNRFIEITDICFISLRKLSYTANRILTKVFTF